MKLDISPRLQDAANPFRLGESERAMTAEDWAWKFLRLNPRYRHDYELAKRDQEIPDAWRHASVQRYLDGSVDKNVTKEDLLALDSRLFVNGGGIVESPTIWPHYAAETLGQHFHRTRSPIALDRIRFRELDAPRDYGINEWVDPALNSLPVSSSGLSWFHWKLDPIWESAHQNFTPLEFLATDSTADVKRVDVVRAREPKDMLPIMCVGGTETAPPEPGTWFAFVISAFTYLKPQLHAVQEIAALYQQALAHHEGLEVQPGAPQPGFEPLIWTWGRQVRCLSKIDTAMRDLLHSHPSRRQWLTVLLDVRFDLRNQFMDIEKRLHALQDQYPEYAEFGLRHRAGNLKPNDFWLKRLAVLAEMLTSPTPSGRFPTATEIECVLFDAGSPEWTEFWTHQLGTAPEVDSSESRFAMIQKSAPEARQMVERGYEFLIGRSTHSIYQ